MKTYIFPYFLGFLILLAAGCSSTKEITLTPSGMTLQEACDEIADGGTIYLEPGTYALPKPLVLRKNVRIIGKNRNRDYVILKGDYENVLYLENGFAEIKNMTIQNTGDSKNAIDDEETEEETTTNLVNNNHIVVVTYGDRNSETFEKTPYKSIILNYNSYAVRVTYNGTLYTVPSGGYVVIDYDN